MIDWKQYQYELPQNLIATTPANPRDSAKLLVYNTKENKIYHDTFIHLDQYIDANTLFVFNNTKVVPCRVWMHKESRGKVEVFFLLNEWRKTIEIPALVDRAVVVGQTLKKGSYLFTIASVDKNQIRLIPQFPQNKLDDFFQEEGTMPIPPYIKKTTLTENQIREKYQPIFAKQQGSVAAPTASLHFTERLLQKLEEKGVQKTEITLHVGRGTFSTVTDQHIQEKKLHTEWVSVSQQTIDQIKAAKQQKKVVIAVGTTVCRTLEFVGKEPVFQAYQGDANLFIYPPYDFKVVDGLITNFHLPKTSLMMLVEAFLQQKGAKKHLIELYKTAIENHYRFYSFGDGMLIL